MFVLAAPEVVIVALVLLLFALDALQFLHLIRSTFDGAPWPISWILTHVIGAQEAVVAKVVSWARAGIDAAVSFLLAAFDVPVRLFDHLVASLESLWTLGERLHADAVNFYRAAERYTALAVDGIAANVITTVHAIDHAIASARAAAASAVDALRADVVDRIAAVATSAAADTAHLAGTVTHDVATLGRAIAGTEAHAIAAADAAVASLAGSIDGLIGTVTAETSGAIDGLRRELVDKIDGVAAAGALGVTAAVAGVLSWIRSGVMATVATMQGELESCLQPNCGWMHSLGTELKAIASGAEVLLLIGFLAEAVTEPGLAAVEVETVINPIADAVYGVLGPLLGLVEKATAALFGG